MRPRWRARRQALANDMNVTAVASFTMQGQSCLVDVEDSATCADPGFYAE